MDFIYLPIVYKNKIVKDAMSQSLRNPIIIFDGELENLMPLTP